MATALIVGGIIGLPFIAVWVGHRAYSWAFTLCGGLSVR